MYPILCLLPYNRYFVKLPDAEVYSVLEEEVHTESPKSQQVEYWPPLTISTDAECSSVFNRRNVDLGLLGELIGFNYSTRLIFLHERELRNSYFWSVEADGVSKAALSVHEVITEELSVDESIINQWRHRVVNGEVLNNLSVRFIDVTIGYGLFATTPIEPNTCIGEYVGVISSIQLDSQEATSFALSYPSCDGGIHIDAREYGNLIRFINHTDGKPNVCFKTISINGFNHIVCVSCRHINAEEQLLVDYGASFWLGKTKVAI